MACDEECETDEICHSDVLHPNRANVSKDELRLKLSELYKDDKDQVMVFGVRTQYGGGKSTGFALIYDSKDALKKFEPHYRLVRIGESQKIEKASRQQRTGLRVREASADRLKASNARTGPRRRGVQPRQRAPRTRNRRRVEWQVVGCYGCRHSRGRMIDGIVYIHAGLTIHTSDRPMRRSCKKERAAVAVL